MMAASSRTAQQQGWLRQLVAEHRQICWLHRLDLTPPVLEIMEDSSKAGSWTAGFASLKIADWLIREHSWDVVLEVLRHEMAHQYVHEVMGQGHQRPHGPAFDEACRKVGVHPRFCRATGTIPLFLKGAKAGPQPVAILTKVEKLFSLAQSTNEHEAALAMAKANLLLRRHNISRLEQQISARYDSLIINEGRQQITAVQRAMAAILKDFFYVQVVIGRQFDAGSGKTLRVIELMGAAENLAVAQYVYFFLNKRLEVLWQEFRRLGGVPGREKRSYHLGVLKGFAARLRGQEQQAMAHPGALSNALICSQDQGLVCFCRQRHPRLRNVRHQGAKLYRGSYEAGAEEGQRLVIHKAVASRGRRRLGLLAGS